MIEQLEISSRYVAGAEGIDIGGDWYSMVSLGDDHFGFAVGDVSGRGIRAATVMARLRFTIRAYLMEGHDPATVLNLCANQIDLSTDGHFATVLVGVGDVETREIAFASAGHFSPLLIDDTGAVYADLDVGLPLGVIESRYHQRSITMAPGLNPARLHGRARRATLGEPRAEPGSAGAAGGGHRRVGR